MRFLLALVLVTLAACGRTEVVRYADDTPDASVDAGADAGVPDASCPPTTLGLEPAVPTVLFVLDRSGSMAFDIDGRPDAGQSASRWDVLETSLRSVLPPLDMKLAMGALLYPTVGDTCEAPFVVNLSPALGNADRLLSLFATRPLGGTPTFGALDLAARHLAPLHTASAARALVLATDGAPNCNEALDPFTCVCTRPDGLGCMDPQNCLDDARTIARLESLFQTSKLPTYVVGLGSELDRFSGTLDRMAVAGGVPRLGPGKRYYSATSEAELTLAFTRITEQLSRCTYLVVGAVPGGKAHFRVGGAEVPEGPEGWEWLSRANGELTVHGLACDRVAAGGVPSLLVDCR
ncbi:MAG: VWA domain-containing protein [Myxococcales bacterium]|nr:VWA domain-containing protein [Myxococcales bacterium]